MDYVDSPVFSGSQPVAPQASMPAVAAGNPAIPIPVPPTSPNATEAPGMAPAMAPAGAPASGAPATAPAQPPGAPGLGFADLLHRIMAAQPPQNPAGATPAGLVAPKVAAPGSAPATGTMTPPPPAAGLPSVAPGARPPVGVGGVVPPGGATGAPGAAPNNNIVALLQHLFANRPGATPGAGTPLGNLFTPQGAGAGAPAMNPQVMSLINLLRGGAR